MEVTKKELNNLLEETQDYAKIISFYIDKGGTGKSTHAYNFSGYCADVLGKRVLVIDGDRSKNITQTFNVSGDTTVVDLFKNGACKPYPTSNKNIDIIIGDSLFTDDGVEIHKAGTKYMEFICWLDKNKEFLDKNYDFIVIDTHNDDSYVTKNLISGSHLIVNIATPDGDSFTAINNLPNIIDKEIKPKTIPFRAKESVVDVDIVVLPNRILFHGNNLPKVTKVFLEEIRTMKNYIGLIPEKKELRESRLLDQNIFAHYNSLTGKNKKDLENFISGVSIVYDRIVKFACDKAKESN